MTEKDYNPEQKNAKAMKQQATAAGAKVETNVPKKVEENKTEEIKDKKEEVKAEAKEKKKETKKVKKVVRELAEINSQSVKVSTKYAVAICKFILRKTPDQAIEDLEKVAAKKIAVPMKGEYAHKKSTKGYASGSGKYPVEAAKQFVTLIKGLIGNANVNGIEEPVIVEAIANQAPRPMARFGRWQRKRTHVRLVVKDKSKIKKNKNKKSKKVNREKKE
jgi:ribosomal protein L22